MKENVSKYKVGDPVYILNKEQKKGVCSKLLPRFQGPAVITEVKSPYIFKVLVNNRTSRIVNHDSLKFCSDEVLPKWVERATRDLERGEQTFCICEKPYKGEFMVMCEACDQWFHLQCVGLKKRDLKAGIDYICSECLKG